MENPKPKDQKPIPPAGENGKQSELSDKELDSASGGLNPQPLPPDKLPLY